MDAVDYTNFRKKLKEYMTQINNDSEPLLVTNKDSDNDIVVLSKSDYDAMTETMRILSNQPLMDKIRRGDKQFSKDKGIKHKLVDPVEM